MVKLNTVNQPDNDADAWLSVFYDGELAQDEVKSGFARMAAKDDSARIWAEYSLIGDVMRGCPVGSDALNARIHAALADEPTVLAPMPKPKESPRTYYLLAAAAAVVAIAWTVLSVAPQPGNSVAVPLAANTEQTDPGKDVQAYLAAHQDYAYAVVGEPDMSYTQISLSGAGR